ncbi:MAG: class I SAM-dependent methyltransferase [Methanosphaera sp.]|nr:class I SAM-dependent methyltransferase [Methanosphaera sp.]
MDDIKDAFNKGSDEYDKYRKNVIPLMDAYYGTVIELSRGYKNPRILDLGAGTGILTQMLHDLYPDSEITLIDLSEDMLNKSRAKFDQLDNINYILGDYIKCDFHGSYDIVVSSLSIHHLEDHDKKYLYEKIYEHLNPEGIFINADEVIGLTKNTEKMYKQRDEKHLDAQDMPENEKDALRKRRLLDKPATLIENIEWFKRIGYRDVDVFYKYYRYFVISGRR